MKFFQKYIILIVAIVLIGIAYALDVTNHRNNDLSHYVDQIEGYLRSSENEVVAIFEDKGLIGRLANNEYNDDDWTKIQDFINKEYSFFIYEEDSLIFWSSNKTLPVLEEVRKTTEQEFKMVKPNQSRYELIKDVILHKDKKYILIGVIPIYYEYDIENEHIDDHFALKEQLPKEIVTSDNPKDAVIKDIKGENFFYIKSTGPFTSYTMRNFLVLFYALGFIFLGAFVNRYALLFSHKKTPVRGFSFLVISIFLIRFFSLTFPLYTVFDDIQLFQSSQFIAPIISGSVIGLFINAILLLWIVAFFFKEVKLKKLVDYPETQQKSFVLGGYAMITCSIFWINNIIRDIVLEAKILFDFDNVFNLNQYSILAFISISLLVLSLFLFSFKLIHTTIKANISDQFKGSVALMLIIPSIVLSISYIIPWYYTILLFFTVFYIVLFEKLVKNPQATVQWMGGLVFTYAIFITGLLLHYNIEKEHNQRVVFAERLAMKRDLKMEEEFKLVENQLYKENLLNNINNPIIPKSSTLKVIEELNKENAYLQENYTFDVHFFGRNREGRRGEKLPFADLKDILANADTTSAKHLSFWRDETDYRYIAQIPIVRDNDSLSKGMVVIQYEPKNIEEINQYPELLTDRSLTSSTGLDYDYAVYKNKNKIKEKGNSYTNLQEFKSNNEETAYRFTTRKNRSYLVYGSDESQVVIVGKDQDDPFRPLSAFSYVFCFLSIFIILIILVSRITNVLPQKLIISFSPQPSLRNRIQVSVIAVIIVTFLTIGLVTFFYFRADSDEYHYSRLGRKAKGVVASAEYWMVQNAKDSTYQLDVDALAKIHRLDINLFDNDGKLGKASQPEIFNKGLIAPQMSPYPFYQMKQKGLKDFTEKENIGTLSYRVAYRAVKDADGDNVGYLGLPYYSERSDFNEDVADFIGTLLNVYVALLVIGFIAAIITANSITRPLFELRDKLKKVELGKKNEPLEWETKDEIGTLIDEYNKMLVELEKSANKLANSEREGAWREMAKQVAHEIKNPLTPMKLSIQYLVRAYKMRPDDIEPMLKRVSYTLIEQIDSLSRIATEFSNFAKMPKAENEYLNINDLITSVYNLFSENDEVTMQLETAEQQFTVFVDKEQLMRVFNNVVKNAIQAIPDDRKGHIDISLYHQHDHAMVKVKDSGCGIPEDKQNSVFVPNFTTKNSGTGLGLAISRKIIENVGGQIYFESEEGIGTAFFIELPIIEDVESHRIENGIDEEEDFIIR